VQRFYELFLTCCFKTVYAALNFDSAADVVTEPDRDTESERVACCGAAELADGPVDGLVDGSAGL
jgi:hypothetical protein